MATVTAPPALPREQPEMPAPEKSKVAVPVRPSSAPPTAAPEIDALRADLYAWLFMLLCLAGLGLMNLIDLVLAFFR